MQIDVEILYSSQEELEMLLSLSIFLGMLLKSCHG